MRLLLRGVACALGVAVPVMLAALPAQAAPQRAAVAAPSAQDRAFLVAAHQSNLAEIQAGKVAQQKGVSAGVRSMGQMLVADHTTLDASLRETAGTLSVTLPDAPNAAQQQMLAQVGAKSGTAFDQAWIAGMVTGHRQAKAGGQTELTAGSDARAIGAARSSAPVIQKHLDMLLTLSGGQPSGANGGTGGQAASRTTWSLALAGLLGIAGLLLMGLAVGRRPAVLASRRR